MKKETIKKIIRGESPSPLTKREVTKKSEQKSVLKGMLQKQEKAIATLKNGTDFEAHYKKGDYQAERVPVKKQPKMKNPEDDLIAVIESANSAIERLKSNDLELVQTSGLDPLTGEKVINFHLMKDELMDVGFDVLLNSKKVVSIGTNQGKRTSETIRKKIEAIFKPYFQTV